jgi:hypothetical protein
LDLVNEFQSFRLGIVAPSTGTGGAFHCGCTVAIFPLERCDDDVDRFARVGRVAVGGRLVRRKVENDRVARARVATRKDGKSEGAGRSGSRSKGADDGKQLSIDKLLVMLREEGTSHTALSTKLSWTLPVLRLHFRRPGVPHHFFSAILARPFWDLVRKIMLRLAPFSLPKLINQWPPRTSNPRPFWKPELPPPSAH